MAQKKKEEKEDTLKGTLASVMILGVFLIVSWFSVYALFLSR
ncbi:cytochrome c oxidase subunit 2A [Bacillus sp. V59.32b]